MTTGKRHSDSLIAWKLIEALDRNASLTSASIELDISLASTSKILSALEKESGLKWIDHTSRPVRLSSFGQSQLPLIREMLQAKRRLEQNVRLATRTGEAKPIIFSLCSTSISQQIFSVINKYKEIDLDVEFDLRTDLDHLDVLNGKADVVMASYSAGNPDIKEIPCGFCFNFLVAGTKYLENFPEPVRIEDLRDHTLILRKKEFYPVAEELQRKNESFNLQTLEHSRKTSEGQLEIISSPEETGSQKFKKIYADDYPSYVLALAGEGIAVDLPGSFIQNDIDKGLLKPVLIGWHRRPLIKRIFIRKSETRKEILDFVDWFKVEEAKDSTRRWKLAYAKNNIPFDSIEDSEMYESF